MWVCYNAHTYLLIDVHWSAIIKVESQNSPNL